MAKYFVDGQDLTDIADAIREKTGKSAGMEFPDEFVSEIGSISSGGGITPTGTKQITANGIGIDVAQYASADVAVPNTYVAADEGKVVSNGALVAQGSDTVTANDTYDTTLINSLTVNVSGGGGGALYPLVNGTKTFSNGATVTVTNGNHVVITIPSGNTADGFVDLSDLSENSNTFNTSANVQSHSSKFTINNGQKAYLMIANLASPAACSFNAYGTGTSNLSMSIPSINNQYGEAVRSFSSNSNLGCIFFVGKTPGTYTFDVRFIVNGVDYV